MRRSAQEHGPAEPAAQRRRRPRYGLGRARRAGGGGSAEGAGAGAPPVGAAAPPGGGAGPALPSEPPRGSGRGSRGSRHRAKGPAHPAAVRPPQARAGRNQPGPVDARGRSPAVTEGSAAAPGWPDLARPCVGARCLQRCRTPDGLVWVLDRPHLAFVSLLPRVNLRVMVLWLHKTFFAMHWFW